MARYKTNNLWLTAGQHTRLANVSVCAMISAVQYLQLCPIGKRALLVFHFLGTDHKNVDVSSIYFKATGDAVDDTPYGSAGDIS